MVQVDTLYLVGTTTEDGKPITHDDIELALVTIKKQHSAAPIKAGLDASQGGRKSRKSRKGKKSRKNKRTKRR